MQSNENEKTAAIVDFVKANNNAQLGTARASDTPTVEKEVVIREKSPRPSPVKVPSKKALTALKVASPTKSPKKAVKGKVAKKKVTRANTVKDTGLKVEKADLPVTMSPRKLQVAPEMPIEKPTEDKVVVEKKISDAAIKTAVKVYEKPLPSPKIYNKDKEPAPFATPNDYMQ